MKKGNKLKEEDKYRMQTIPMLASVHWNFDDDVDEDIRKEFELFNKLDIVIKNGLYSETVRKAIISIAKKVNIEDKERVGEISRIVREVFTKHISEEDIIKRVINNLKIEQVRVKEFMTDLKNTIVSVKEEGQKMKKRLEKRQKKEVLAIIPAMKKYKEIGEQLISLEPIKLEIFREPVRPSIKNWLEDYRETMGTDKSSIKRSSYLFTSENAKGLNPEDRKKVSLILKSYNEDTKLIIDPWERRVVFEMSLKQSDDKNEKNQKLKSGNDIFVNKQKSNMLNFNKKIENNTPSIQKKSQNFKREVSSAETLRRYEDKKNEQEKKKNNKIELENKTKGKKQHNLLDLSEY